MNIWVFAATAVTYLISLIIVWQAYERSFDRLSEKIARLASRTANSEKATEERITMLSQRLNALQAELRDVKTYSDKWVIELSEQIAGLRNEMADFTAQYSDMIETINKSEADFQEGMRSILSYNQDIAGGNTK